MPTCSPPPLPDLQHLTIYLACPIVELPLLLLAWVMFLLAFKELRQKMMNSRNGEERFYLLLVMLLGGLMLAFATIHVGGVLARTFNGFISDPQGPRLYFAELKNPETVAAEVGQFGAIVFSDIYSVYRLYLACWKRKWPRQILRAITFVLSLLAAGSVAAGVFFLVSSQRVNSCDNNFQQTLESSTSSFLSITLGVTLISAIGTSYILTSQGSPENKRIATVYNQSAVTYSVFVSIYLGLFQRKNYVQSIFSTMLQAIASMTFSWIIIIGDKVLPDVPGDNSSTQQQDDEIVAALPDGQNGHANSGLMPLNAISGSQSDTHLS